MRNFLIAVFAMCSLNLAAQAAKPLILLIGEKPSQEIGCRGCNTLEVEIILGINLGLASSPMMVPSSCLKAKNNIDCTKEYVESLLLEEDSCITVGGRINRKNCSARQNGILDNAVQRVYPSECAGQSSPQKCVVAVVRARS